MKGWAPASRWHGSHMSEPVLPTCLRPALGWPALQKQQPPCWGVGKNWGSAPCLTHPLSPHTQTPPLESSPSGLPTTVTHSLQAAALVIPVPFYDTAAMMVCAHASHST